MSIRTEVAVVVAFLTGCTVTQVKPCASDPAVCGSEAWCNPVTQLCERPPVDLAMPDLTQRDSGGCMLSFTRNTQMSLAQGTSPTRITLADLNKDKFADLVFVEPSLDRLTIMLGVGDGSFATARQYSVTNAPHDLAIADFNADGNLDVAVLGQSVTAMGVVQGTVQVFTGVGDGTLNTSAATSLTTNGAFVDLYAGTFTGTPLPDLVSLITSGSSLAVFKNSGAPSLTKSTITYTSTPPMPPLMAAGDVNGDGYTDVISARKSGTNYFVTVTYSSLSTTPLEQYDSSFSTVAFADLAAVDVNRDGRSDAVAVDTNGLLHVWYGPATKAAPTENGRMIISAGTLFNQLAVGDFDGDGYGDVAAMNKMPASLYVYSGSAAGLVAMPQKVEIESINNDDIAVGDINGDGRSDILLLRGVTTSPLQLFPYLATCL